MARADAHSARDSVRRRAPVDRSTDRRIALTGVGVALVYLGASFASLLLPSDVRGGLWLPVHLALAGGATGAIAGVMPFFVAALAAAPPADARLRASGLGAVVLGAAGVSLGVTTAVDPVAVAGGTMFVVGLLLTGLAVVVPVRRGLGPSRGIVTAAYLFGVGSVATGASLATLYLSGWAPLVEAWGRVLPAHAWLNLFGFVSLVIATTLLHLFPTVVGSRIAINRSAWVAVLGLGLGAVLKAAGYALEVDLAGWAGSACTLVGALAFCVCIVGAWRRRARWRTDPGWHRFATGSLLSAIGWFIIGIAIAVAGTVRSGSSPDGWSLDAIVAPIVVGWIGLALVGSATHLVPAVGPGDAVAHAEQRALLGAAAVSRLVALDPAIAALTIAVPLHVRSVTVAAAAVAAAGFLASAALLVRSIGIGLRRREREI